MTIRVALLGLLCIWGVTMATALPASAGCHWVEHVVLEQGTATVVAEMVCTDDVEPTTHAASGWAPNVLATTACIAEAVELFGFTAPWCGLAIEASEPEQITGGVVTNAFRRLPLPPSELIVQPPNGRTLVNFETNFYTETQPFNRTVRLLGQRVDLQIWPSSFEWHFGDGATTATESAGAPYPHLEITHNYAAKGTVGPSVDTTYAAEFRVNGGAWRPVPGTVTIPGTSVNLDVVEATPTLVGYN